MLQQESEVVAETDTRNTKRTGGNVGQSFLDKIRENKTTLIWIGVIAAIAVIVSAIMVTQQAASKGGLAAEVKAREAVAAQASASVNTLGSTLNDRIDAVEDIAETATGEAGIIGVLTTENTDAIGILQDWKGLIDPRLTTLEQAHAANITSLNAWAGNLSLNHTTLCLNFTALSTALANLGANATGLIGNLAGNLTALTGQVDTISTTTTTNDHDINALQDWQDTTEPRITVLESQNSPPKGYLTGTLGHYTLHAKCNEAGNFTANVHLVYSPPLSVGNGTTQDQAVSAFYGSINWGLANRDYVPTLTYNGSAWGVSQVWFNIGTFAMAANNETAIDIIFSGLTGAYSPDFAYVEVWPVLK